MTKKKKTLLYQIFQELLEFYGPRKWWPARTRFEVITGAILVQNVSWRNAKIAIDNLKKAGLLNPKAIISARHNVIARQIKSSRFYNQKAKKLKAFCIYLLQNYNGSLNKMFLKNTQDLRDELLRLKGIGKETADSILLYAGGKLSFVSDAYTKRFLTRLGMLNGMKSYEEIRKYFMENIPPDVYVYNEFHALIDHHCHFICKSKPDCDKCFIKNSGKTNLCSFAGSYIDNKLF
ncbi:MAG: hypothetical protein JW867_02285 [Candidatus Omnitrophica bacterium]|nr:hypothetical protein [Candidatus Omnitrophota bacterium]